MPVRDEVGDALRSPARALAFLRRQTGMGNVAGDLRVRPGMDAAEAAQNGEWAARFRRQDLELHKPHAVDKLWGSMRIPIVDQRRLRGQVISAAKPLEQEGAIMAASLGFLVVAREGRAHQCAAMLDHFGVRIVEGMPFAAKRDEAGRETVLLVYRGEHVSTTGVATPCAVRLETATRYSGGTWQWTRDGYEGYDSDRTAGSALLLYHQVQQAVLMSSRLCTDESGATVCCPVVAGLAMHPNLGLVSVMVMPLLGPTACAAYQRAPRMESVVDAAMCRFLRAYYNAFVSERAKAAPRSLHADTHMSNIAFAGPDSQELCMFDPGPGSCSTDGSGACPGRVSAHDIPPRTLAYLREYAPALGRALDEGKSVATDAVAAALPLDFVGFLLQYCTVATTGRLLLQTQGAKQFGQLVWEVICTIPDVAAPHAGTYGRSDVFDEDLIRVGSSMRIRGPLDGARTIYTRLSTAASDSYCPDIGRLVYALCATGLGRYAFICADVAYDLLDAIRDVLCAWDGA